MSLFLVGGGPDDGLDEVWDAFVQQARGRGDRVVIAVQGTAEQAAQYLPAYRDPILARWPEARLEVVELLDVPAEASPAPDQVPSETAPSEDPEAVTEQPTDAQPEASDSTDEAAPVEEPAAPASATQWPEDLENIAALVVGGGWTPGYLASLAPKRDLIARLVRRDLPYLGFSAGAAIASRHALVGGWRLDGQQVGQVVASEGIDELTVTDGLALVSPTVQVHNDAWGGDGIVITLLERGKASSAVAIDEATCLTIDPINGRTQRLGRGRVRWFQADRDAVLVRTDAPDAPTAQ